MANWQGLVYTLALATPMPVILLAGSWWYHLRVRSGWSAALLWSSAAYFIVQVPIVAALVVMQPYEGGVLFDVFLWLEVAQSFAGLVTGLVFAVCFTGVLREAARTRMRLQNAVRAEPDGSSEPT